jgi:hypothetical protein
MERLEWLGVLAKQVLSQLSYTPTVGPNINSKASALVRKLPNTIFCPLLCQSCVRTLRGCSSGNSKSKVYKARLRFREVLQEAIRSRAREKRQSMHRLRRADLPMGVGTRKSCCSPHGGPQMTSGRIL